MPTEFSDYVVYVDESGDHGLASIDPEFPVFVLAFCVFEKSHYINSLFRPHNESSSLTSGMTRSFSMRGKFESRNSLLLF
jgi:hypothetical protein